MMLLKYEHVRAAPALPHIVEVFLFFNQPSSSSPFQESQNVTILPNNKKKHLIKYKKFTPATFDLDRFENLCDYSVEEGRLQKKSGLNLV